MRIVRQFASSSVRLYKALSPHTTHHAKSTITFHHLSTPLRLDLMTTRSTSSMINSIPSPSPLWFPAMQEDYFAEESCQVAHVVTIRANGSAFELPSLAKEKGDHASQLFYQDERPIPLSRRACSLDSIPSVCSSISSTSSTSSRHRRNNRAVSSQGFDTILKQLHL